jgi:hypothetical protein
VSCICNDSGRVLASRDKRTVEAACARCTTARLAALETQLLAAMKHIAVLEQWLERLPVHAPDQYPDITELRAHARAEEWLEQALAAPGDKDAS